MIQKVLFSISLLLYIFVAAIPAGADTFNLQGRVKSSVNDTDLFGVNVRLLNATDSSLIAETEAIRHYRSNSNPGNHELTRVPVFIFNDLNRSSRYVLELSCKKYETLYLTVDPSALSSKSDLMDFGDIYMRREAYVLDEVVVKASQVVLYNKGDTLIYNANALTMAEGSMLDALIQQLPGVELKDGGQIYVNGRYVESLLLNGKDFFKGNNRLMLDNLAAYTVKNIAVYERQNEMDKIMGDDYGIKHLAMDVRLKKEYNQGLMSNIEVGYGSSERYLGRIFAMWYSDNARITLIGNANNLNDNRKPGQKTTFTPSVMKSGNVSTIQGGLDYWAKIPFSDNEFHGDVMVNHEKFDDDQSVLQTNFLPAGNTYGYTYHHTNTKKFSLSTNHFWELKKKKWNIKVNPMLKYIKNNDWLNVSSGTFSDEQSNADKNFVDDIFNGATSDVLSSLINRYIEDNTMAGHSLDASLKTNGIFKMPNGIDGISYRLNGSYNRNHYNKFQDYTLNFGNNPTPAQQYSRHYDDTPNYKWVCEGALGYILSLKSGMSLTTTYEYSHEQTREVSNLYSIENLADLLDKNTPNFLPSVLHHQFEYDASNSYNSYKKENRHSLVLYWQWQPQQNITMNVLAPFTYRNQHIDYVRGDINSSFSRDRFFLGNLNAQFYYFGDPHIFEFVYSNSLLSPNLVDMIDFTDRLDPLNIRLGNPGLKDSRMHRLDMDYRHETRRIYQFYGINATLTQDALAYGYSYDPATGVKTGRMYNVNGNYSIGLNQRIDVYFGSSEQFVFKNSTKMDYFHNVDLLSENSSIPQKNKVENYSFKESVGLKYKFIKNEIGINADGRWSYFSSRQPNFRNFTAKDYTLGLTGNFVLPAGFGLSTDFNTYIRKGYSDRSLNKTNFVWNARASYSMLKGQLTFMVDGFDLLHNLSNVFYRVNAQARTETYTSVLPRYVLFHILYKFNKAPKK
ncbi:MAG: outer membrane beta-barrel protein [Muribaculaceae bacterium]|nr:outer membrane beta-barrel protein [Muribaculaceae bacterium]